MADRDYNMRRREKTSIDVIKGVLILMVLWGHIIQNLSLDEEYYSDWIFKMIYSFHMPLFALINGYLYYSSQRKRSFVVALRSKIIGDVK